MIDKKNINETIKNDYRLKNNSFIKEAKSNPKDKISVIVGDDKQPLDFLPQAKIERWDNEVNFSARLVDNDPEQANILTNGSKIIYSKTKSEAHFYDLPVSAEHPEGAFEIEVILKEKPDTNVIEYTIQHKGLEFFLQPEITDQEAQPLADKLKISLADAKRKIRPENVVGSYAVYYKDCPLNIVGQKEYKTGKFGHLFYPYITDAKGKKVRAEAFTVDPETGLLRITIPQSFLDKAVYPVIVDPTFGYTSGGASGQQSYNQFLGSLFTGEAGTATKLTAWLNWSGPPGTGNAAIYRHSDLALLVTSSNLSQSYDPTYTEQDLTISDTAILAEDYILGYWGGVDGAGGIAYDTGSANQGHEGWASAISYIWSLPLPNPVYINAHTTKKYSIYATYTAGGGTDTSDERAAKTTGKSSANSSRDAKITGKQTANTERAAKLTGIGIVNSERAAKVIGKATANSERAAKISGTVGANSERGAKLTGVFDKDYTREALANLPADDTNLSTEYTSGNYLDVADDDDQYVELTGNGTYFVHQFKKKNNNSADQIDVAIILKTSLAPSAKAVYLQIYNRTSAEWENVDINNSENANTEFTLSGSVLNNLENYYDVDNWVSFRIYQGVI